MLWWKNPLQYAVLWGLVCCMAAGSSVAQTGTTEAPAVQPNPYTTMDGFHSPFARVAQLVGPAVVYIEVRKDGSAAPAGPFGNFFDDLTPRGHGGQPPSAGSGFGGASVAAIIG